MKLFGRPKEPIRNPRRHTGDQGYVFRRSRTLTGTPSAKVVAGAEQRSQLKTARLKAHELHQFRRRILRIMAVLAVCVALLSYVLMSYIGVFRMEYPQLGGQPHTATYEQTAQKYFVLHPFERFGFSLDRVRFGEYMQQTHPELLSVDVDRAWYGGDARFVLQFRKPLLVWESGGHRFYVDGQGTAFEYDHFKGSYVAVSDQSGISPQDSGGSVASNRFINFLGKMVGAVNAGDKGTVTEVIIPASTRQVDLKLEGRGYHIKTHTDRDPLRQAEDIINTLTWLDDKQLKPEYVDVRVEGKAYFK